MTEDRLNELTRAMGPHDLRWVMRWCEPGEGGCSCLGCAATAARAGDRISIHPEFLPHLIEPITKAEWQAWWRIMGQRLGGASTIAKKAGNKFLIYSREHNAWWRANSAGYTRSPAEAGQYTMEQAFRIVDNANAFIDPENGPNEFAYPAPSPAHLKWSH